VRRADNPTTLMCRLSRNPGALTSWTPQGHVGLFRGYFTFFLDFPKGVVCCSAVCNVDCDKSHLILKFFSPLNEFSGVRLLQVWNLFVLRL
jgi:hypothetical protein